MSKNGEDAKGIDRNRKIHDKIYRVYEKRHPDQFLPIEQERIRKGLTEAIRAIQTGTKNPLVLDYGCGVGNFTRHLLKLGTRVVAADVSKNFLALVKERYPTKDCTTLLINGADLGRIKDETYDMVATCSVLHHIPDYLKAVSELIRVTKKGGIIYFDLERSEGHWNQSFQSEIYTQFLDIQRARDKVITLKSLRRKILYWLNVPFQVKRYQKLYMLKKNPRYEEEGDIHVFPDDHIEWKKIFALFDKNNCEILKNEDFLYYQPFYNMADYKVFKKLCSDSVLVVARKK